MSVEFAGDVDRYSCFEDRHGKERNLLCFPDGKIMPFGFPHNVEDIFIMADFEQEEYGRKGLPIAALMFHSRFGGFLRVRPSWEKREDEKEDLETLLQEKGVLPGPVLIHGLTSLQLEHIIYA
jgi:hypothetical protein